MSAATRYRQLPSSGRSIGFELQMPGEVDVQPVDGDIVVRCRERRDDGKTVGELEVAVFRAALVIDRDGILEDKVSTVADGVADQGARVLPAIPVELPGGATGYRADVELTRRPLPYVYVFAIAPHDGVDSGLLVTIRSATPEWAAADAILKSLRILGRRGATANDAHDAPAMPLPPLLGKRG
ncbi:MAG: hypothetical protein ACM31C_31920 [Acidobacteriota bacterium]